MELTTVPLLGTPLAITDYQGLLEMLPELTRRNQTAAIDFCNTQIVTMRRIDPAFRAVTAVYDYFIPDGMPLIWCLRAMGATIHDRIYGPSFMRHAFVHEKKLTHYFLGGSELSLLKLREQARVLSGGQFQLVGARDGYQPPSEHQTTLDEINRLSPDVIWIGLGTPKQQQWIHDNKHRIARGVLLAVGFAFDVNAGTKRDAPAWMQKLGLTWIFRISQEPGRLLKRYLKYNTGFVALILIDLARHAFKSLTRSRS